MHNTHIANNNRSSAQQPRPPDLDVNLANNRISNNDNVSTKSPLNHQPLSKGAFDVYQTLIDLQHGNDQMKRRSTPSTSGVDAVGLHPSFNADPGSAGRQPSFKVPLQSKMNALDVLTQTIVVEKRISIGAFVDCMMQLFAGLESCLRTQQLQLLQVQYEAELKNNTNSEIVIDIVLKANQFLFEIMPDIQNSKDLEIHMANLIPIFIENLGSPKAVVRKSTHKCIGTYVKLTKKLEFVLRHIIQTGLENQNSRTRQHSMLVIPALLSLKASIMESVKQEMADLLRAVITRIQSDSSEIVAKTGKKLVLELQKCYPTQFKQNYVDKLGDNREMQICKAIIMNDDAELKKLLSQPQLSQKAPLLTSAATTPASTLGPHGKASLSQMHQKNELSSIGREIMMNVPQQINTAAQQQQLAAPAFGGNSRPAPSNHEVTPTSIEKAGPLSLEAVKSQPSSLVFGFLHHETIDALDESNAWKDRAAAIEQVESQFSQELSSNERKARFLPHATAFLGFIIAYIKDMNFKLSLTAINITNKLLVLEIAQVDKHYNSLARTLIEKLSDSKVVIRQAVLKCCSVLIRGSSPCQFANYAIGYLGHTNWHVREGILHLIANCLIVQDQQDELNGNLAAINAHNAEQQRLKAGLVDQEPHNSAWIEMKDLAVSQVLIGQLAHMAQDEIKAKIQQMAIDDLALCIEISKDAATTEQIIRRELGIQAAVALGTSEESHASRIGRELFSLIKQRQNPECLPAMQIDGSIEFKPADQCVPQHGDSLTSKSRAEFKPSAPEYQLSPGRQGGAGADGRHAHKTQQPSMMMRVRGTPPVDTEELKPTKLQAKSIDHPSAVKRSVPLSGDSAVNEKIQTWLPSFKSGQEKEKMTEGAGSELSYDPLGAFQGTKRRVNGVTVNSGQDDVTPANSNQNSFHNIRRQTSLPKGPQTTALSTAGGREDVHGGAVAGPTVHTEPLSAGLRLSNNNLRNLSQQADNNIEIERNLKLNSDPSQPFNSEQRFEKLMQGYTPIQHHQKPRIIQSNEIRQRTLENVSIVQASPSPKLVPRTGLAKNEFASIQQSPMLTNDTKSQVGEPSSLRAGAITGYNPQPGSSQTDMKVMQVRNMSQSSGAPGGFGVNKAAINERLQLLKSTFKYKNQSEHETQSNLGDARTFDNTDRRLKYDAGNTGKKANSEYNAREDTKLPAVTTLNNNNYMMQTGGGVSGVSGSQVSAAMSGVGGSGKAIEKPQQTLNSFALSNVSTNVNNNFNGGKSYSANKQLQSTNTTGYNFGGSGHDSKNGGGLRRDLNANQYNAYESTLLENHNLNRSGLEKPQNSGKNLVGGVKGSNKGPIKATPIPQPQLEYMNTIQVEQNIRNGVHYTQSQDQVYHNQRLQNNAPSVKSEQAHANANKKPPVSKGSLNSLNQQQMQQQMLQQRASSVSANMQLSDSSMMRDNFQTPKKSWNATDEKQIQSQGMQNSALGPNGTQTATHYNAPEEPLRNPEAQFKQSVQDLKEKDWQKIFEGLNTIKRVAQFHKELLVMTSSPIPKEAIKLIVKLTENLRSQISKNACMTLQVIYSELSTKDLDSNMELVMHALLKKSTDTNHFVSEQAEKALMMVCHACSETKVLNCIQMAEGKGPSFRQKVALSYCFLIEKLGPRIRSHKDSQRIVKAVVNMLGEGAVEARNQAKIAIAQIKNNIQNGREFDGLLMRSGLTEQQIEQAKKVADQSEYNSLSQVNNTRYGGSMRGSSMDSRAHGSEAQRRTPHVFQNNIAMGSDGFSSQNFTDQKMQQTFLSGGAHPVGIDTSPGSIYSNNMHSNAFGMTNTSHQPSFKKRQTSMSKPIDPALMEEFKGIVQQCSTHDWSKRLQSIDQLDSWIAKNQTIMKQAPASKFIQLVDIKCKMIQDNNAKVQSKAMASFKDFLMNESLQHLKEQNLTIILQGISANLASSQPSIRMQTEQLMSILEETIDNKSHLVQPIIAQVNLQNTKSKVQLVQRLAALLPRIEQVNVIERYVQPLVRSNHKIQSEATLNPKLREALRQLEMAYQQVTKR